MNGDRANRERLRDQIDDASRLALAAETELDEAVAQLCPVEVGDKRLGDESLDDAFAKLRGARALVTQLRVLLVAQEAGLKLPAAH